ncbi:RNA polymerase sigma factor SigJ [Actinocatenispora thailandica]
MNEVVGAGIMSISRVLFDVGGEFAATGSDRTAPPDVRPAPHLTLRRAIRSYQWATRNGEGGAVGSGTQAGDGPGPDTALAERRQLINVAYRLLGSLAEAEDVVQETYARWYAMSEPARAGIASPGAWLTTVASRICLNLLGSARMRRERYVGDWIPEPLPDTVLGEPGGAVDPADRVSLDESVNMAFLVVLDAMTPAERVAFILHDVFRYSFVEVADIVGRSPAACRKLASSARHRLGTARATPAPAARHAAVVRSFRQAWEAQDIDALLGLLDPAAVATADSGGNAVTFRHPIEGGDRIARAWVELARRRDPGTTLHERTVNGAPGLVVERDGAIVTVFAFDVAGDRIRHIWVVRNPDKLRHWSARPGSSRSRR